MGRREWTRAFAPFVLIYVAVGFMMEALFRIRLPRGNDSDGTDSAG